MSDEANDGYNGWASYETWLANNYLIDDETIKAEAREAARQGRDALRELLEQMTLGDDPPPGFATDLIMSGLDQINLREIAEALLEGEEARA